MNKTSRAVNELEYGSITAGSRREVQVAIAQKFVRMEAALTFITTHATWKDHCKHCTTFATKALAYDPLSTHE